FLRFGIVIERKLNRRMAADHFGRTVEFAFHLLQGLDRPVIGFIDLPVFNNTVCHEAQRVAQVIENEKLSREDKMSHRNLCRQPALDRFGKGYELIGEKSDHAAPKPWE